MTKTTCRECALPNGEHRYLCSREPNAAFFALDHAAIARIGAAPGTPAWEERTGFLVAPEIL